jgi:ElaA protein
MYRILQLRSDIFVVEQSCVFLDLDGRDLESETVWLWAAEGEKVLGGLRILRDPEYLKISRVTTAKDARGRGTASVLMKMALARCAGSTVTIDAQTYLLEWYQKFGFVVAGPDFLEDGIQHTPMQWQG